MQTSGSAPQAQQLAADLDQRLRALNRVMRGVAGYGMSLTAATVLARLRDLGPQRITELAIAEAVAQPTMTSLVHRLERDGFVERRSDERDARVVLVVITAAGHARLAQVREARSSALAVRLAALDPQEQAVLAAALPALDHLIEQETPDD
jgi:DNA-binding MarR family transcriptional regulator